MLDQFIAQETGQIVSFDHLPDNAGQCVQLVALWCQYLGLPVEWENAADWFLSETDAFAARWTKVVNNPNDPNQVPEPGDVVVFGKNLPGSGGCGHIDIFIRLVNPNLWVGFDSNWGGKTAHEVDHNFQYVLGWYTPTPQAVPAPLPVVPAVVPPPPAPAPEAPKANLYVRFPSPMSLVANKQPTKVWDLSATTWVGFKEDKDLGQGDPFVAVGKYSHPLGGVYFMDEASFGQADTTGSPTVNEGINTIDLSPAPPAPSTPVQAATTAQPVDNSAGDKIPVTVTTWQQSFQEAYGVYKTTQDIVVKDLAGVLPDQKLGHDAVVKSGGTFTKGDTIYYRTVKSMNEGKWYGIDGKYLVAYAQSGNLVQDIKHPAQIVHAVADDIEKIAADMSTDPEFNKFKQTLTPRGRAVIGIAEAEQKVEGFASKINVFKKKYKG